MAKTNFLPETDGFAFANSWTFDDVEKARLHDAISAAAPAAIGTLSPLLLGVGGPVLAPILGLAEPLIDLALLLGGPFLPLIAWEAGNSIMNSLLGAIEGVEFGLCSGMAYAALDYYRLNWVVPRGLAGDNPIHSPDGSPSAGGTLRDYLWERSLDNLTSDAVTWLTSMAAVHFLGDVGASWILEQSKSNWTTIKTTLDAGAPLPVCLLTPSIDPTHNHVLLAIDYHDQGHDPRILYLYDVNWPDTRPYLEIRFDGTRFEAKEASPGHEEWAGIFAASYSPKTPPLALGVSRQLEADPEGCLDPGQDLVCSFEATNLSYRSLRNLRLAVDAGDATGEEADAHSIEVGKPYPVPDGKLIVKDPNPGTKTLRPACVVQARDNSSLAAWKVLPNLDGTPAQTRDIFVAPRPKIGHKLGLFGPGKTWALIANFNITLPGAVSVVAQEWTFTGETSNGNVTLHSNSATFVVAPPPLPGTGFEIDLAVTLSNGCTARRHIHDYLLSKEQSDMLNHLLTLAHEAIRRYGPINPLGDPVRFLSGAVVPTQADLGIAREVVRQLGQMH
jgi:hypothetical protein